MYNKNIVTKVSTDSLRRHIILKALDWILKISSVEEFGENHYKIWNIEINSFEDLEKNRVQLKKCMKILKTMISHDIKKQLNMLQKMELIQYSIHSTGNYNIPKYCLNLKSIFPAE
jgi:hypothetical protein